MGPGEAVVPLKIFSMRSVKNCLWHCRAIASLGNYAFATFTVHFDIWLQAFLPFASLNGNDMARKTVIIQQQTAEGVGAIFNQGPALSSMAQG